MSISFKALSKQKENCNAIEDIVYRTNRSIILRSFNRVFMKQNFPYNKVTRHKNEIMSR